MSARLKPRPGRVSMKHPDPLGPIVLVPPPAVPLYMRDGYAVVDRNKPKPAREAAGVTHPAPETET